MCPHFAWVSDLNPHVVQGSAVLQMIPPPPVGSWLLTNYQPTLSMPHTFSPQLHFHFSCSLMQAPGRSCGFRLTSLTLANSVPDLEKIIPDPLHTHTHVYVSVCLSVSLYLSLSNFVETRLIQILAFHFNLNFGWSLVITDHSMVHKEKQGFHHWSWNLPFTSLICVFEGVI